MDKLHRLNFFPSRVNLCTFRTMKVPTKILLFPLLNKLQKNVMADLIRHLGCVCLILCIALFASCSNSNEELVVRSKSSEFSAATKSYFVANSFHFALPQKYIVKVDTVNWSWGDYLMYRIKDSVGNQVMSFEIGMNGLCSFYLKPCVFDHYSDEFSEIGRRDEVKIVGGEKTKERIVCISAPSFSSPKKEKWNIRDAFGVEICFIYHPDQVDTAICENIIRSAKIHSYNKNYLCSIYVPENNSLEGASMSKLRDLHIKDIQTLTKNIELLPVIDADQNFFEKRGKYVFLADCFMNDEYKGSFHINESCEIGWNGKYAEKEDVFALLMAMDDKTLKEKLMKKCQVEQPPKPPHNCSKLYKLNIHFSENDVPQAFDFTYHSHAGYLERDLTINSIRAAIDYDGIVQLRSDGKISEFPISYEDPGEEKKLDESKITIVKSLLGKTESTTVSDLWGTGSLFTRSNFFKEKWEEMRILTPLFSDFRGLHVSGYACSDWLPLREVTKPKCKGRTAKLKNSKSKTSEPLPADSLMKRIKGDIDAVLDCAEEDF